MSDRLDAALVERGLARSRTQAARLIADGFVTVDGRSVVKASLRVGQETRLEVTGVDSYVSRAAAKLLAALDGFSVDPTGRLALDAGASTGGFTQVLLERGARRVLAIDVGHGQLDPGIAADPRVLSREGINVRTLHRDALAGITGTAERPSIVVADLSFISLRHVLPALRDCADDDADFLVLIKPQFEVGRQGVREGIVRDAALRAAAIAGVLWAAWDSGLGTVGLLPSPIAGTSGNREYLAHLRATGGRDPSDWEADIPALAF
ncbi:MAG: TlyA family rRNA (cytidine-2-O)-methyltransferase [Naasia sp.]|uniref:TlyA family RNA methyltransferase n=1 Tax=Naasia sp. TaxID=2546198 RepID=UPI0026219884|nr:TlyA family RNA methyltransferase [Naasia sp.]MCU1571004.1 TlyA family rRNA (cytidine-2-O)-methyltransferase [Naasia sp.]